MISSLTKKHQAVKTFIVFAHDLRTKDETSEFAIKARNSDEARCYFIEDFPQNYWKIQDVELID